MRHEKDIKIITGTIGDDIHSLGIKVIEQALKNEGYKVIPLGIQTSQEEYIAAANETAADAILVSSMSGHGRLLCKGFKDKCIEAGLGDVILYVGGSLTTGDTPWDEIVVEFKEMGFNRVYPNTSLPGEIIADLRLDFGISGD